MNTLTKQNKTQRHQRDAKATLAREIELTKNQLSELLKAWHEYEDAHKTEAPVVGYPFTESLDEVVYNISAMRLSTILDEVTQ